MESIDMPGPEFMTQAPKRIAPQLFHNFECLINVLYGIYCIVFRVFVCVRMVMHIV